MKVFHVLEAVGGGTALHLKTLAKAQTEAGNEVVVAVSAGRTWGLTDSELIPDLESVGATVHVVGMNRLPLYPRNLKAARTLYNLLRREVPDVVHTHSTAAGVVARPVSHVLRIPTVHTPNGVNFANLKTTLSAVAARGLERLLVSSTDAVIAVSQSEAEVLAGVYPRNKIVVVPNGIVPSKEVPPFPDTQRLVAVNRLAYQKDPESLVRILASVRNYRPNVEALIVGDGPLLPAITRLISDLDPGIQLVPTGLTGRQAIALSTAVVLASRWEGAPYVPLEAMDAARPVVATDVVGSRDVVVHGETGYLFSPRNHEEATKYLLDLIDAPNLAAQMGFAGRHRLLARYTADQMAAAVAEVYRSVSTARSA